MSNYIVAPTQTASAARRGRNPKFPYVPIVVHYSHRIGFAIPKRWTKQIRGKAYADRNDAVAYAQRYIDVNWKK